MKWIEFPKKNWKLLIFLFILIFVIQYLIFEIFFRLTGEFPVSPTNYIAFFSEAIVSAVIFLIGSLIVFKFAKK
jgi:flagellar biosynthesis protein FlhB